MANSNPEPKGPLTGLQASIAVMQYHGKPMKASEVAQEVLDRKLAPSVTGKNPKATLGSQLHAAAKAGKVKKTKDGFTPA